MNLSLISQCLRIYWPVIYMINKKSETKKKKTNPKLLKHVHNILVYHVE